MIDKLKALNKKTIALVAVTAVVLVAGIVGAVTFLKDDGTTAATELQGDGRLEGQNLPVAGNDIAADVVDENQEQPENPLDTDEDADADDEVDADADTDTDTTTTPAGTGTTGTGTGAGTGTTGETTYQEFVTEETYWVTEDGLRVGWSPISINSKYSTFELGINKPGLKVTKTADKTEGVKAGETVVYTIEIENIGQIAVKDVVPSDVLTKTPAEGEEISLNLDLYNLPDYDENGPTGEIVEKISVVEVGQKVQLFAFYTVTQDDIENEVVLTNSAVAENGPTKGEDDEPVNVEERNPVLEVTKVANENVTEIENGKSVTYTVTVANRGNVELTTTLTDTLVLTKVDKTTEELNVTADLVDANGNKLENPIVLAVGEERVYTYTYTDNAEDLTVDSVKNKLSYETETRKPDEEVKEPDEEPEVIVDVKNPELTVTKTVENGKDEYKLGDTITYVVTISNTGEIDIENINVEDVLKTSENNELVDLGRTATLVEGSNSIAKLVVGDTVTLKYTYTVVEADLGKTIVNTVVAKGGNTEGDGETPGEDVEERNPSVNITKVAEATTIENGGTVNYTVTVENTGNVTVKVTLSDVITKLDKDGKTLETVNPELKDKDTGSKLEGEVSLAPGAKKVYVYSYTDDSNEIEVNKITNKITSNVTTDTQGEEVEKPEDPEVEVEVKNPSISVTKVADKTENVKAGELITYTITVKNTSEVEVKDLTVTDTLKKLQNGQEIETVGLDVYDSAEYDNGAKGNKVTKIDSLKAGEEVKLYAFYTVTLADVENQYTISNSVVAEGGPTTGGGEEDVDVEDRAPNVEITKVADATSIDNGGVINYEVKVKNTGNVEVKVTLSDVLTKLDKDGKVVGTENPTMTEKGTTTVLNGEVTLAPGEEKIYVYSYTDSREDLAVEKVTNKVTGTVTTNDPDEVVDPEDPTVEVEIKNPDLTVTKVAENKKAKYVLGDVVVYNVTITNSGETALTNVTPTDAMEGVELVKVTLNGTELTDKPASIATMNVGDVAVYTYNYTIKEADLGKTEIENEVSVTTNETPDPDTDKETVVVDDRNPNVEITKTSDVTVIDNGSTVNYEVKVKNTGNVKVTVTLSDVLTKLDKDGKTLGTVDVELKDKETNETLTGSVEIAVGAEKVYVYSYTDDSSDITVEKVTNKVTSTVTTENEEDPEVKPEEPTVNVEINNPSVDITKTVTSKGTGKDGAYKLNETITYEVTVKNNGEVALTGVKVADVLKEKSGETLVDYVGKATTTDEETFDLAVGADKVLTYTYTITEADLGKTLVNTANVDAGNTGDEDKTPGEKVEDENPGLNVTKTASATTIDNKGTVTYTVVVENTGNTTLTVNLADEITKLDKDGNQIGDKVTLEGIQSPVTLAPYATTTITYTYTDEESTDVEVIRNNITATTDNPDVGDDSTVDVSVNNPSLDVTKTVENAKSEYALNDVITYVVKVTNNGKLDLSNVKVEDVLKEKVGEDVVTFTKQATLAEKTDNVTVENNVTTITSLPINATETLKYTYTIVEADLGKTLINTVTAEGENTDDGDQTPGEKIEDEKPGLNVTKTASATTIDNKGTVTYTVVVENTGNTTLTVSLADAIAKLDKDGNQIGDKVTVTDLPATVTLNPYTSQTFTYSYTDESSTDVEVIRNNITATTDDPNVKDEDNEVDVNVNNPSVDIEKEVTSKGTGENGAYKLGETITYKVTVKNNGELALTNVTVADVLKEKSGETLVDYVGKATTTDTETFDLPLVGEKVLTYTYTITETDLGKTLVNTVTAKGEDTDDGDQTPGEKVEDPTSGVKVEKTASTTVIDNKGTVTYTVVVENTGNTTLTVSLADEITKLNANLEQVGDKVTVTDLPASVTLGPKGTETAVQTFTYSYTDESSTDVEVIRNNITATTDDPNVGDSDTVDVAVDNPSVDIEKEVTSIGTGENGAYKLGETITYKVTVTNNGELALTNVTVADVLKEKSGETLVDYVGKATTTDAETFDLPLPGEKVLTYTYTITEADLGKTLVNTVTAKGEDTDDGDQTPGEKVEDENPGLTVTKVADKETIDNGESVTYTVTLTNTGNTTIKTKVNDVLTKVNADGTETTVDVVLKDAAGNEYNKDTEITLDPLTNPVLVLTYTYTDDAEDTTIDVIKNKVTATVTNKDFDPEDPEVTVEVNNPSVSVEKKVTSTGTGENGEYKLGETITYEVTITNDGETVLENMVVADVLKEKDTNGNLTTLANQATLVNGNETIAELVIGDTATLVYEYTITEADLGKTIVNTVTASGSNTTGGDETPGEEVEDKNPSLNVEKTVSKNGRDYAENVTVGYNDTVKYKMVVTNNGNLTLNVTESDVLTTNKVDATAPTTDVVVVNEDGTEFTSVELAPEASVTLYYDYGTIDQDKVNTINTMDNTITVNGVNPIDNTQTATDNDNATVTVLKPNITATKESAIMNDGTVVKSSPMTVKPGDVITYTITVTNNGATNGNATVVDEIPVGVTLVGTPVVSDTTYTSMNVEGKTITVVATSMPANASFTITFTAQVDAINNDVAQTGLQIVNNVKVDGTITDTTTDTVSKPVITAVKTSEYTTTAVTTDTTSTTKNVHEGDTIVYTMTIKNLGLVKSETLTFDDILPDGVEYVSSTGKVISWGTNASGSFENEVKDLASTTSVNAEGKTVVTWDSTELDRGQKAVLTVTVKVKDLGEGEYSANITNNTVSVKQNDLPVVEGTDPKDYDVVKSNIAVSKAVKSEDETKDLNGTAVRTGTTIKYIITATNAGATEAETVTITDNLDTTALRNISATVSVNGGDATALDVTDGNISYTTTINPNDTVVIKVTATTRDLNDGETLYRVNNTADYTYDGNSGSSNTVTTEVKHLLEISKTVTTPTLTNTAEYGDKITYTITAKNLSGVSEPVTIVDEISDYLSDVRNVKVNGVENTSIYNSTTHTITYNGTLANLNDTVTITFDATVNTIDVGSVIENTAYVNDVPAEAPDVKVVKEVKVTVDALTQNPLDIILVIDTSNSMTNDNSTRFVNAKSAANALIDIVFPEAVDTKSTISLVSFGETATIDVTAAKGTEKETLKTTIGTTNNDGLTTEGGTNIYDALTKVDDLLDGTELTNTNKIVIFLSDGAPTTPSTYNSTIDNVISTNRSEGYSNNIRFDPEATTQNNIETKAAEVKAHANTRVYSIGLSVNTTDMNDAASTNNIAWAEYCNDVESTENENITYAMTSNSVNNYGIKTTTYTITITNSSAENVTLESVTYAVRGVYDENSITAEGADIERSGNGPGSYWGVEWEDVVVPANGTKTLTISVTTGEYGNNEVSVQKAENTNNNTSIGGTCTNPNHKVSPYTDHFKGTVTKNGKVYHYMTTYGYANYIMGKIATDSGKYHSNIGDENLDQLTALFEQIIRENISGTTTHYTESLPAVITIPETGTIIGNITAGVDGVETTYTKAQLEAGITGTGYTLKYTAGKEFVWTITSNDVLYKELTLQYAK